MNAVSPSPAVSAAAPLACAATGSAGTLLTAAQFLLPHLERGERIGTPQLRRAMEDAFGATDATGAWDWKAAYDAGEAATVLFLRRYGRSLLRAAPTPASRLALLTKIAALLPTHTRRSEESQALQQFSTPLPLALAALTAAAIAPADTVLEPSAGTGLLAILAEISGAAVALNELGETRANLLASLFPGIPFTRFDAAQIHDHLDAALVPSVVLMNPPFSALANVQGPAPDATLRHITSALARLADGGRLVAITGAGFSPEAASWRDAFIRLQGRGRVVFTAAIDGSVYAAHGTTVETRLTVIDKLPAEDSSRLPASAGLAPDVATLLAWIERDVPPRLALSGPPRSPLGRGPQGRPAPKPARSAPPVTARRPVEPQGVPLAYQIVEAPSDDADRLSDAIYEPYALQSIRIPGAQPHPTQLCQSAAMAAVVPPKPSYRPILPPHLVTAGILSDAQLETVILAGEAHASHLSGHWTVDDTFDVCARATADTANAVQLRRGFMLGDGTGAGKGRQTAAIILDNWLQGRRKAVWVSKSDTLIEDAQRDWSALGMERLLVTPLSRFAQGKPITLPEGILFTTFATLRTDDRGEKDSRVKQIVEWLGRDFDGVLAFDESHAMQNAAGGRGSRGEIAPSQQGRAGLRIQNALPNARVLYASATGATVVSNLAYARRLGLWGGGDLPFETLQEFISAIDNGGVAAMEVLARDMRALGLYTARTLSFEGVEYEVLEHQLTPEQVAIYDAYAGAFTVIHGHLDDAMHAANIMGDSGTLNREAKSAARSAFESTKQRFFGHLLTSMKTPAMIAAIEQDLADGYAAVIQIVSTGEALTERRLAEIPTEEWGDVQVDVTPREYVLSYLQHAFPVQLYEPFTDAEGNISSRPVYRDGQPVLCREAVDARDALIERLAALAPVPAALDQIVQHFGTDRVAEATGRQRRIVRKRGLDGVDRLVVESRPGNANLAEAAAFMDDAKRVLVFSEAGGTGRSYHADRSAKNQRLRVHYLLEAGWKAPEAIQGLGRAHRSDQAQPPLFRLVTTNVKAEKRFISTIARRLDTFGAITRGSRETGGQGLYSAQDNLESAYARDALYQLYSVIAAGKIDGCPLVTFEAVTGLRLTNPTGGLLDELPRITTFLNRLLALTIDMQGVLFAAFEQLLAARIEGAIASGTYDLGLETLQAESFSVLERRVIYTHPGTGAETRLLKIVQRVRTQPVPLAEALQYRADRKARFLVHTKTGRAAVQVPAGCIMLDDGSVEDRVRLIRPMKTERLPANHLEAGHWIEASQPAFATAWWDELAKLPEFTESTLHVVSGLLLPIWKRLPTESSRVYRLKTDAGERIIGRQVSPAWAAAVWAAGEVPTLSPEEAHAALIEGRTILDLQEGMQLRRVRVMNAYRIELVNYEEPMRDRLRSFGLFSELIAWKLRLFLPIDAGGVAVLANLLDAYSIVRIIDREAA